MFEMLNKTKIFLKSFFESTYFLILISVLTIINYQFDMGMITYNVTALFLILMVISKSNFVSLPSIFIFALGGGLTGLPNFRSFWFILFCILAVLLLCVLGGTKLYAQKTEFDASAPSVEEVGEQFRLSFE